VIDHFHQADDPYSFLIAQRLAPLRKRYWAGIRAWLVPPPDDAAAPERARLNAYARRDAPRLASEYGLSFPQRPVSPSRDAVALAQRALTAVLDGDDFAERAVEIGHALWCGDHGALARYPARSDDAAAAALAEGAAERTRLGHYLGGMLHHDGTWYWGVDRLSHLEEKLAADGRDSTPDAPRLAPYRDLRLGPVPTKGRTAEIEMWFSFRSPYSWIAFPRVRRLARHYGAMLTLRPILPMVMRGLPVSPVKSLFIVRDAKREADRAGLPFGPISDPVGAGAERALAVAHHSIRLGCGEDFAESALRAAWAEGVALADDAGLFATAARAGLTQSQVVAALGDESWREAAEANRVALFEAGLWGAPTYRVNGGAAHWGQDRLWALEQDLVSELEKADQSAPAGAAS